MINLDQIPFHVQEAIRGKDKITVDLLGPKKPAPGLKCYWCRKEDAQSNSPWCSKRCASKFSTLKNTRSQVLDRDKKRCRICHTHVKVVQRVIDRMWWDYDNAVRLNVLLRKEEEKMLKAIEENQKDTKEWQINERRWKNMLAHVSNLTADFTKHPYFLSRQGEEGFFKPKRKDAFMIEEVIPISDGGTLTGENLRTCCTLCFEKREYEKRKKAAYAESV